MHCTKPKSISENCLGNKKRLEGFDSSEFPKRNETLKTLKTISVKGTLTQYTKCSYYNNFILFGKTKLV